MLKDLIAWFAGLSETWQITILTAIILPSFLTIGKWLKDLFKRKPYSVHEKDLMLRFVKEFNFLRFYLSDDTDFERNIREFAFSDVNVRGLDENLKEEYKAPICFNDTWPTVEMLRITNETFFPKEIKRRFHFICYKYWEAGEAPPANALFIKKLGTRNEVYFRYFPKRYKTFKDFMRDLKWLDKYIEGTVKPKLHLS